MRCGQLSRQSTVVAEIIRWEYKIVGIDFGFQKAELELNKFGANEWEVVALISEPDSDYHKLVLLKRPYTD